MLEDPSGNVSGALPGKTIAKQSLKRDSELLVFTGGNLFEDRSMTGRRLDYAGPGSQPQDSGL